MKCLTCDRASWSTSFVLREMFLGTRDEFEYGTCGHCGSIQRVANLSDAELERAYPPNYYAFASSRRALSSRERFKLRRRARFDFGARFDIMGRFLAGRERDLLLRAWLSYGLRREMRVLDVGCGSGQLLYELADRGMTSLLGVDPYIAQGTNHGPVKIVKGRIDDVVGPFDFIMFNHSLEHVADPEATLSTATTLLAPDGVIIVRLPTCSCDAFLIYGKDWLQLDPPRHTFIPSRSGMAELGRRAGLTLAKVFDDSLSFQFWGSEQYRRGIALTDPRSFMVTKTHAVFSSEEMDDFERRARELNALGRGDQAAFQFRRSADAASRAADAVRRGTISPQPNAQA